MRSGSALLEIAGLHLAREWWSNEWSGKTAMVIGMTDPVLGPPVMEDMRQIIRNCPEQVKLTAAGHFVQEWGEDVLKGALPLPL